MLMVGVGIEVGTDDSVIDVVKVEGLGGEKASFVELSSSERRDTGSPAACFCIFH